MKKNERLAEELNPEKLKREWASFKNGFRLHLKIFFFSLLFFLAAYAGAAYEWMPVLWIGAFCFLVSVMVSFILLINQLVFMIKGRR